MRAACGYNPESFTQRVFARGQGVVGKAAETGEPIIFEDVQNDPRYAELSHSQESKGIGYRFLAVSPNQGKGEVPGRDCVQWTAGATAHRAGDPVDELDGGSNWSRHR